MVYTKYITDVKGYIQALFEDAVGLSVVEMEKDWKEFLNTKSSDSVSKMDLAYELAQPYKEVIPFTAFFVLSCVVVFIEKTTRRKNFMKNL